MRYAILDKSNEADGPVFYLLTDKDLTLFLEAVGCKMHQTALDASDLPEWCRGNGFVEFASTEGMKEFLIRMCPPAFEEPVSQ